MTCGMFPAFNPYTRILFGIFEHRNTQKPTKKLYKYVNTYYSHSVFEVSL